MLLDAGVIVGGVGGALLAALGAFVASLRPRTRANLAFAGFALSLGLAFLAAGALNVLLGSQGAPQPVAARVAMAVFFVPAAVALVLVAFWFPAPLASSQRGPWLGPAILVALYLALSYAGLAFRGGAPDAAGLTVALASILLFGGEWFALLVFALRFSRAPDASARSRYAIASAGIGILGAFQTGVFLHMAGNQFYAGAMNLVVIVPLVALWLRNARGTGSAQARNVAVLIPAAVLVGMLFEPLDLRAGGGVARTLSVAIFAYGILRHQLLGIDLRVRWTISKGSVAAAFVGVFFVVTELAQEIFATSTNSAYWGIAGAGALLFAIAPLQRAADRLADAATGIRAPASMGPDERATLYREQARLAWADGTIGRRERMMLNHLRRELRLEAELAERAEEEAAARPP